MKKLIPLLALAVAMSSHAQDAEVNFANNVFTPPRLITVNGSSPGLTGTNWSAVLLYGTSASSLAPHPMPARFRPTTTSQPGTWAGGIRTLYGIPNVPGTQVSMQVAIYDNVQFANYAAALAAGWILGSSSVFTYTVSTPPLGPTSLDMANFGAFIVWIIPEPSVIALAPLGVLALWAFKRRRSS